MFSPLLKLKHQVVQCMSEFRKLGISLWTSNWISTLSFSRFPVWWNKLKASLGQEHFMLVPSSGQPTSSVYVSLILYIRKTLKHGQFWKSNTWHLPIFLWDDSLPGWANGSSIGQSEPAPYQEAFRDPGASYHDYCHEMPWTCIPSSEFWHVPCWSLR